MNIPNGIKTFMPVLAEEEKTNKALIAAFWYTQTPGSIPTPHITVANAPTPMIGSLQARFWVTSVKLKIIIQNNKNDFILIHTLIKGERLNWHPLVT